MIKKISKFLLILLIFTTLLISTSIVYAGDADPLNPNHVITYINESLDLDVSEGKGILSDYNSPRGILLLEFLGLDDTFNSTIYYTISGGNLVLSDEANGHILFQGNTTTNQLLLRSTYLKGVESGDVDFEHEEFTGGELINPDGTPFDGIIIEDPDALGSAYVAQGGTVDVRSYFTITNWTFSFKYGIKPLSGGSAPKETNSPKRELDSTPKTGSKNYTNQILTISIITMIIIVPTVIYTTTKYRGRRN